MTTRRDFVVGAGAVLAASNLPGCAREEAAQESAERAARGILEGFAEKLMVDYPENATALGIHKDTGAALKSNLSDRSVPGRTLRVVSQGLEGL